jgi:glutamate formiminotransferase/formiminotetrahydrofolate cyclodeaminase
MGATDVCPFIPVSDVSWEEAIACAEQLGKRVGEELKIPVYLYEKAARDPARSNLAVIRAGEYEGFRDKIKDPAFKPDFGDAVFNEKAGATVIGAREFLVAYNVNLNTRSVRRANSVAFDVREQGRIKTEDGTPTGKKVLDADGRAGARARQAEAREGDRLVCRRIRDGSGLDEFNEHRGDARCTLHLMRATNQRARAACV